MLKTSVVKDFYLPRLNQKYKHKIFQIRNHRHLKFDSINILLNNVSMCNILLQSKVIVLFSFFFAISNRPVIKEAEQK